MVGGRVLFLIAVYITQLAAQPQRGVEDLYEVLGVGHDASAAEIRKAYRMLALTLHPDKTRGNAELEAKFLKVSSAYGVLADAAKRKTYDETLSPLASKNKGPSFGMYKMVLFVPLESVYNGATLPVSFNAFIKTPWGGTASQEVHSSVSIEPGAAEGGEVALDRVANAIAGIYSEPHKLYKRLGDDLLHTVELTFAQANQGYNCTLLLLDGSQLKITHSSALTDGQTLLFEDKGLPMYGGGGFGDLQLTFTVGRRQSSHALGSWEGDAQFLPIDTAGLARVASWDQVSDNFLEPKLQRALSAPQGSVDDDMCELASGKATVQVSTASGGASVRAVDGSIETHWNGDSCTHTADHNGSAWWQVDLGNDFIVSHVRLWNRGDCCGDRLKNFGVSVCVDRGCTDGAKQCGRKRKRHSLMQGTDMRVPCADARGRHVRIDVRGKDRILTLCEVEVFGRHECASSLGIECSGRGRCVCGTDRETACSCAVGYKGAACSVCDTGYVRRTNATRLDALEAWGTAAAVPTCVECPGGAASPCTGHGTCGYDGGAAVCECNEGFVGERCQQACRTERHCRMRECGEPCSADEQTNSTARCGAMWSKVRKRCCRWRQVCSGAVDHEKVEEEADEATKDVRREIAKAHPQWSWRKQRLLSKAKLHLGETLPTRVVECESWAAPKTHRKMRCSESLWQENPIARVAAEARCDADVKCKGLMFCHSAINCYGGWARGTANGWYQACGGDVASVANSDWTTFEKKVCPPKCEKVDGMQCNGRGECVASAQDGVHCNCTEPGYTGMGCGDCVYGYFHEDSAHSHDCLPCPGGAANPCSGHGECDVHEGDCACQPGYEGDACELQCEDVAVCTRTACGDVCDEGETANGAEACGVLLLWKTERCCHSERRCNGQLVSANTTDELPVDAVRTLPWLVQRIDSTANPSAAAEVTAEPLVLRALMTVSCSVLSYIRSSHPLTALCESAGS